jgi:hypothetical protein
MDEAMEARRTRRSYHTSCGVSAIPWCGVADTCISASKEKSRRRMSPHARRKVGEECFNRPHPRIIE